MYQLAFNFNGTGDFAQVIQQVYLFMVLTDVSFTFNGHSYSFTYWECFITTLVFSFVVDVLIFGFHTIIRRL